MIVPYEHRWKSVELEAAKSLIAIVATIPLIHTQICNENELKHRDECICHYEKFHAALAYYKEVAR